MIPNNQSAYTWAYPPWRRCSPTGAGSTARTWCRTSHIRTDTAACSPRRGTWRCSYCPDRTACRPAVPSPEGWRHAHNCCRAACCSCLRSRRVPAGHRRKPKPARAVIRPDRGRRRAAHAPAPSPRRRQRDHGPPPPSCGREPGTQRLRSGRDSLTAAARPAGLRQPSPRPHAAFRRELAIGLGIALAADRRARARRLGLPPPGPKGALQHRHHRAVRRHLLLHRRHRDAQILVTLRAGSGLPRRMISARPGLMPLTRALA